MKFRKCKFCGESGYGEIKGEMGEDTARWICPKCSRQDIVKH